jgi:hypothetical protein
MKFGRLRTVPKAGVMAVVLAIASWSLALAYSDPMEFEQWNSRNGDGTYSLTYLGTGCPSGQSCECDWNDKRFRVNINRSSSRTNWRMWSGNGRYQKTPSGDTIYGHSLPGPASYVCIGFEEFQAWWHPLSYWTTSGVQRNLYTWRR